MDNQAGSSSLYSSDSKYCSVVIQSSQLQSQSYSESLLEIPDSKSCKSLTCTRTETVNSQDFALRTLTSDRGWSCMEGRHGVQKQSFELDSPSLFFPPFTSRCIHKFALFTCSAFDGSSTCSWTEYQSCTYPVSNNKFKNGPCEMNSMRL